MAGVDVIQTASPAWVADRFALVFGEIYRNKHLALVGRETRELGTLAIDSGRAIRHSDSTRVTLFLPTDGPT